MKSAPRLKVSSSAALLALAGLAGGCAPNKYAEHPSPLGSTVDPFFMKQEENAEASNFVIHEHEFQGDSARLNEAGQDHVKQIAKRLEGVPFPVIVARSKITAKDDTSYGYPVHANEELDLKRRTVVVEALAAMGVADAERRVVVGPYLTFPYQDAEAEGAYFRGIIAAGAGGGGGGGGGGGFGGGGGGGGGGGAF
jgi:uncharacterized membrane protein YgcG